MKNEKRIMDIIKNVPVGTNPDVDRAVRDKIMAAGRSRVSSCVQNRPGGPFGNTVFGKFVRAGAAVLIAGCFFVAGGVVFNFAGRAGWSVQDSIDALRTVESVVIRNSTNFEDDVFVHVKGDLYSADKAKARYETRGLVFIHNEQDDIAIEKSDGGELLSGVFGAAEVKDVYPEPVKGVQTNRGYAAMLLPVVENRGGKDAAVSIDKVEVKKYYVVCGVYTDADMRYRTIVDAETNLPVSTTRWRDRDGSVVFKSEVLEYNADIPDELFDYYQPK